MSAFSRAFLRTSRCALKYQRGVNPVQQAWGVNGLRNYASAFARDKPHVNIGTIGHVDHGKACCARLPPQTPCS